MLLNLLPKIKSPSDVRKLNSDELNKLADELRHFTIETVTEIGGRLAPTLGVIELTVALHKVFNTPKDKIVWDVGHQGYAHKILTGRLDKFNTIRKMGGLSGFLKISESEYEAFGAGHASTSISAALHSCSALDKMASAFSNFTFAFLTKFCFLIKLAFAALRED